MAEISAYTKKYNEFTQQLLQRFYEEKKGQNLVLSPFSILMLLAIAADATDGITREEILHVIDPDLSSSEITDLMGKIQTALTASPSLSSANAVCVNHAIEDSICPNYADTLNKRFSGELFTSRDIVSDVNDWVDEHTNGLIDSIADESMKDMLACFLNAIAFSADWHDEYEDDDIYEEVFTCADGSTSEIEFLHRTEDHYIESDDFTGFVKPYMDADYSFMALLPKDESTGSLTECLTNCNFTDLLRQSRYMEVYTAIPEFTFSFDQDLTAFCKTSGIERVFTDLADFSPISSVQLKADAIIHKARIEVDRKGTKAAAVTAMFAVAGCAPSFDLKYVELTRPFLFAIMHNETGLPVFTGIVNQL